LYNKNKNKKKKALAIVYDFETSDNKNNYFDDKLYKLPVKEVRKYK
jgi:glutathionylspermidine synthase